MSEETKEIVEIIKPTSKLDKALANPSDSVLVYDFLSDSLPKIAEAVTGALIAGKQELFIAGSRVAQSALKGNFLRQFAIEIHTLIEKGKIDSDYSKNKFGFQTFTEVLKFIDEEEADEDRLIAIKAMFYAVNKKDKLPGKEILDYQIFKLSKKLTASQLLILTVLDKMSHDHYFNILPSLIEVSSWLDHISKKIGHSVITLISQDCESLTTLGFLMPLQNNQFGSPKHVPTENARLSDLGIAFCENLKNYQDIIRDTR